MWALALALVAAWRDPAPHRVRFVEVEPGVKLEVLDWGGKGRPIVLLGGYTTGHAYDELAPRLKALGRVYAITRRGLGASTRTESWYGAARSAADVVAVLDKLKLRRPILAGHSYGGQDLHVIGARYPDRAGALVYLNSAEDATLGPEDFGPLPLGPAKPAPREDRRSYAAYREWQRATHGVAFPEAELRQIYEAKPDGSLGAFRANFVRDRIARGFQKPDYRAIRVPVLAFFAWGERRDDPVQSRHARDLREGAPAARVIDLPGASYWVFLSHPGEIVEGLQAFIGMIGRQ